MKVTRYRAMAERIVVHGVVYEIVSIISWNDEDEICHFDDDSAEQAGKEG